MSAFAIIEPCFGTQIGALLVGRLIGHVSSPNVMIVKDGRFSWVLGKVVKRRTTNWKMPTLIVYVGALEHCRPASDAAVLQPACSVGIMGANTTVSVMAGWPRHVWRLHS